MSKKTFEGLDTMCKATLAIHTLVFFGCSFCYLQVLTTSDRTKRNVSPDFASQICALLFIDGMIQ